MLLILTNSQDVTADYLASVLVREGIKFLRFDTDSGIHKTKFQYENLRPVLFFDGAQYTPNDFMSVWYRRPERVKHAELTDFAEGKFTLDEWTEALEGFFAHVPKPNWMNHPAVNVAASHKVEQLTTANSLGFLVPDTLITQEAEAVRRFAGRHDGKVIVKPMSKGYVERQGNADSLVYTNRVLPEHLDSLDDLVCCPTLFQELIEKRADVRITVVDHDIHTVEMTAQGPDGGQRCDIRRNNMDDVNYRAISLPPEVESKIRSLMAQYALRFAAIDMVVSLTGEWFFLEVNPNGQWAWMDLAGSTNIAASFVRSFRR